MGMLSVPMLHPALQNIPAGMIELPILQRGLACMDIWDIHYLYATIKCGVFFFSNGLGPHLIVLVQIALHAKV